MLRILIRLWWLQQRRNFHWRDAFVASYIVLLYVVVGVSFYVNLKEHGSELPSDAPPAVFASAFVVMSLLPDILLKMTMKRDITVMDDYVKTRPIPEKMWNRFLLVTNLVSYWNYVLPLLTMSVLFLLFDIPHAIGTFLLMLLFSYVNGMYVTCWRKATGWMLKWPLLVGWMGMFLLLIGSILFFSFLMPELLLAGMGVFAVAILAGLTAYLCHLKIYNETKRKTARFRGFSHVSLFSLQYIGIMRAKRVRYMVLLITGIFLFDAYLNAFIMEPGDSEKFVFLYVVGAVLLPSLTLSQWTFGVEANYFQGLLTKPVRIEQLLRNCFYFYVMVSAVAIVPVIPFLFITDIVSVFVLVGAFCMAVFLNLFNLPTCLFSSRLEIFKSSMFNMQGANMKINFYSIVFLLPMSLSTAVYYYIGETAWCLMSIVLAVLSIVAHRWVIGKVAAIFYKNRHKRMEKFMES